jgi:hypothetical protein
VDALLLPFVHHNYASARVGLGVAPASTVPDNLVSTNLHLIHPPSSSFWIKPTNVAEIDLATGFNRRAVENYGETIWSYAGPKNGYGGHAGFEVASGSHRIKLKFGEVHSEPFTARIFHALGFNVDPTDFSPGVKVRFDRRLFAEFNSRKPVNTKITLLGVLPVWTIRFQPVHDPTKFFARIVLKDGTVASPTALPHLLSEADPAIDYLVTVPANVQPKVESELTIGPWSFDQLGHQHRRELRGAGLLAAWLGWHDSRFENTRLRAVEREGHMQLKHYFSDLGGGLGRSVGMLSRSSEDVDGFPESFTKPELDQGPHRMRRPFRIVNFRPIERTEAFEQMTIDDARWMAYWIAQLTPAQIHDALRASGFTPDHARILLAKLLNRRFRMLHDLDLLRQSPHSTSPSAYP